MSETKIQKSSFCTFISVYIKLIPPMFKSWKKISKRDTKHHGRFLAWYHFRNFSKPNDIICVIDTWVPSMGPSSKIFHMGLFQPDIKQHDFSIFPLKSPFIFKIRQIIT